MKDEKKEPNPHHQFFIRVKYLVHLESEYEDTFLSLFVPCTKFCLGWEPLLDKKFTLRYQMTMVRHRGKEDIKVRASHIEDFEAGIPNQSAPKEKTFGDKIGDFVSSITGKKDEDKKKEDKGKHPHRRSHRRHRRHRHRKHSDTDSSTGSYSDSSSSDSSDGDSEDEREHRKKHHHHKSKPEHPVEQPKGNDKSPE